MEARIVLVGSSYLLAIKQTMPKISAVVVCHAVWAAFWIILSPAATIWRVVWGNFCPFCLPMTEHMGRGALGQFSVLCFSE